MAKKEQKDNHEAVVVTARVLLSMIAPKSCTTP